MKHKSGKVQIRRRLVCNKVLIQEFFGYPPRKKLPPYNVGEYGGRKYFDGFFYRDRFRINKKVFNKMVSELKVIRQLYRDFHSAIRRDVGGVIIPDKRFEKNEKLFIRPRNRFRQFHKRYGEFFKEIVLPINKKIGPSFQNTFLFDMGKLGNSSDRKLLCSFINTLLGVMDIKTFSDRTDLLKNKSELIDKARALRKQGITLEKITEILRNENEHDQEEISVPTISRWVRDI